MSHTWTKKWHSEEFTANRQWTADTKGFNTKFPDYPFKPPSRAAFLEDCRLHAQAKADVASRKAAGNRDWRRFSKPNIEPFNGKIYPGHEPCPRGPVLGQSTIWIPMEWYPKFKAFSPWPSLEQMKYEGDDRVNSKSGRSFGRYLALPRWPNNNPTVSWTMWDVIPAQRLDEVWQAPTAYDIYLPEENEMEPAEIPLHLNEDLLDAIKQAGAANC